VGLGVLGLDIYSVFQTKVSSIEISAAFVKLGDTKVFGGAVFIGLELFDLREFSAAWLRIRRPGAGSWGVGIEVGVTAAGATATAAAGTSVGISRFSGEWMLVGCGRMGTAGGVGGGSGRCGSSRGFW
jgi:hypothetical protein